MQRPVSPVEKAEKKQVREHFQEDDFVASVCKLQRSAEHEGTALE